MYFYRTTDLGHQSTCLFCNKMFYLLPIVVDSYQGFSGLVGEFLNFYKAIRTQQGSNLKRHLVMKSQEKAVFFTHHKLLTVTSYDLLT